MGVALSKTKRSIRAIGEGRRCEAPDGSVMPHDVIVTDREVGQATSMEAGAIRASQHPVYKGRNLLVHEVWKFVHGSEGQSISKDKFNKSGGHFFLRVEAAGLRRVVGFFLGAAFFFGVARLDVSAGINRQQAVSAD